MKFLKKNKKIVILMIIGILLILSGTLSWHFYFSKVKIFKDNEKLFLETVERYYSMNSNYLPSNNNTKEMTLQELYEGNHISDLYVPKTKKLCDSNSWVRVYNKDGKYSYTTYLKCGKFESHVDHTGPVITLNGESEITLALGGTYQELGVSKVYDKVDGNLNPSNVVIDSSSLDTNKAGTYKVTYTIRDKAYNKTVVTRKVTVARNLTNVVKDATDDSNYYKGLDPNNYLLFSGMLFRIVNVNSDGSVKIVSYDNISNVTYGNQDSDFNDSNVKDWLNNYFYSKIHDTSYLKEDNVWCIDNASSNECSIYSEKYPVGMLSVQDYRNAELNGNYLNATKVYMFLNKVDNRNIYIHYLYGNNQFDIESGEKLIGVRPSLVLKENLYIVSGNGSENSPYRIGDYTSGIAQDYLNTRIIGEYVSYFGMNFRISDIDKSGNVKLISNELIQNNSNGQYLMTSYDNENKNRKFNIDEEGNIGYKLNNDYLDYMDDKYIISHEYNLPTFSSNKKYSEFENEIFKAKISIPASFEIFSAANSFITVQRNYWLLDYVDGDQAFIVNNGNGGVFTIDNDSLYTSNGFKIVFYVSKNVKIISGNGTNSRPYVIK